MADEVQAKIAEVWNNMDASWESYGKILEDKARMNAGRVAVLTEHEQITYDQLDERVNRAGNALEAMGIQKDDKVCVMLPNIPEFLYTWWGNAKLGGITVPLNTALKGEGLAYIINHSDAETLVLSQHYVSVLEEIRGTLSRLKRIIVLGPEGPRAAHLPTGAIDFAELLTAPATSPMKEVWSDDIDSIMYTSGTTGLPKGVIHRHARCYGGFVLPIMTGYTEQDMVYNTLPLFHIGGQSMVWMALVSDTTVAQAERFSASRFWQDVRAYGATFTLFLGAMIPILHKQPPRPDDHANPLRVALSAAAPRTIWEEFEQRFDVKIVELYSQTEGGFLLNADARVAPQPLRPSIRRAAASSGAGSQPPSQSLRISSTRASTPCGKSNSKPARQSISKQSPASTLKLRPYCSISCTPLRTWIKWKRWSLALHAAVRSRQTFCSLTEIKFAFIGPKACFSMCPKNAFFCEL